MPEPAINDKSTVNLVVLLLGLVAIVSVLGIVVLLGINHDGSTVLAPIATACIGGIAGLLANTKSVDVGGLDELNQASLADSKAAAALHARLTQRTGDFNVGLDGEAETLP